jgi:hypothetical protein
MSKNDEHSVIGEGGILEVPDNCQPVHWEDTLGAIFLGIFSIITLVSWMFSEARYRKVTQIRRIPMEAISLSLEDIVQMTMEVGGNGAIAHTKRSIGLVK